MKRYDPIEYYDQGGDGYGQMEEVPNGDYVKVDDFKDFEKEIRESERIKYALELRDMDSHTAMDNICDTALKGN